MGRLLTLMVMLLGIAWGQQQTIYQNLLSNSNPSNGTVTSVVANNGQAQHMLSYLVTAQPAKTCTIGSVLRLEGSFNGINFLGISPLSYTFNQSSITAPFTNTIFGYGIYPYVRAKVILHDVNNCLVSVWYGGTLFPASPNDVSYTWLGLINQQYGITAATTSNISSTPNGATSSSPGKATFFGLSIVVPTGATLGIIQCTDPAVFTTVISSPMQFSLAGPATLIFPASKQPLFQCPDNTATVVTSSGTGTIRVNSLFRYE